MSLLIVNAYAAAMIGRLRSLPLTFLGALLLGLLHGLPAGLPRRGEQPVLRLDVRVRGAGDRACSSCCSCCRARGCGPQGIARTREIIPMPTMRGTLIFAAVVVAGAALAIPLLTRIEHGHAWRELFGIGIVALSMVPLIGLAGQVSLAQWALAGIGAVTMAHLGVGRHADGARLGVRDQRGGRRAHRASRRCASPASTSRSRRLRSRCSSIGGSSG